MNLRVSILQEFELENLQHCFFAQMFSELKPDITVLKTSVAFISEVESHTTSKVTTEKFLILVKDCSMTLCVWDVATGGDTAG
jgi:hypothetical protein